MDIPKKYTDIVGTIQSLGGGLFSGKVELNFEDYNILDFRIGSAHIVNMEEIKNTGDSSYEHPTIEYLVKNDCMKKSRWTRGFAIREINLKDHN